jgi:glucokinase
LNKETVLVGDGGGTNIRFALAQSDGGKVSVSHVWAREARTFAGFEEAVSAYLDTLEARPDRALFALAGPPTRDGVKFTNLDWIASRVGVQRRFGFSQVDIVNDFAAMARCVPELAAPHIETLSEGADGADPFGPIVIAGPGTGLGLACLLPKGAGWQVVSGEGGHQAYAARDTEEDAVLVLLRRRFGYVPYEKLVSGPGLLNVYQGLCQIAGIKPDLETPKEITANAPRHAQAEAACRILARALLGFLGDACLAFRATGGAVVGGGLGPHIRSFLTEQASLARFRERGVMSGFMAPIPVKLIDHPHPALVGAGALCFDLSRSDRPHD